LYVFSIAFTQLAAGTVMGSFYFPTAGKLGLALGQPSSVASKRLLVD
jgi:hypothetical protein